MKEQFLNLTGLTELVGYLKTSIANHKEILPYASNKLFPSVGDINTIYIDTATNTIYRWDSSSKTYVTLAKAVKSVAISEATENGKITLTVDGNKTTVPIHGLGSAAYTNSSAYSPAGHTHTKAQVGLGNVDNTADANKSVKHAITANSATTAGTATNVSAGEGTADAARHVWFSDSTTETKRAYSDKFKYNPVTNNLTVNVTGNAATASSVAWGNVTGKPSTYAPSAHNHDDSTITSLNASKLFGTIDIARLPHGALERCVIVADDTARFALTTAKIQLGDTVKVTKTQKMYFVIDDSKLNSEAGYTVYTAGSATSVPWSGVTGKPSTFTPSAHTHPYLSALSVSGKTITYTKGDGTTGTITTQDTWRGIQNNLTSTSTTDSLSAAQGKILKGLVDGKLSLSGGTMTGTAVITWPDSGNYSNSNKDVTFPVKRGGLSWIGQSDGIQLFAEETANDNLELILKFADDNSNGLTIRNKDGTKTARISASGGISATSFTGNLNGTASAANAAPWSGITGKPSTYPPSSHTHNYAGSSSAGGNAYNANALYVNPSARQTSANYDLTNNAYAYRVTYSIASSSMTTGKPPSDAHILTFGWDSNAGWGAQIAIGGSQSNHLYIRGAKSETKDNKNVSTWESSWRTVLDSSNYTSHTVTKTGSGASGTWGINVSGNAAYPQGFQSRVTSATWGNQTGTLITDWHTSNGGDIQFRDNSGQLNVITDGFFYQNEGKNLVLDSVNYSNYAATKGHTHNYAGSASAGGSANSAVKLDTATAGSATQPVYFTGGKPSACTYTLGKSVPSNAVFTDTNTKVTQTAVTSSEYTNWRTIPWGASNSGTEGFTPTTVTDSMFSDSNLTYQPSTGTLKTKIFKGSLSGNASSATNVAWTGVTDKPDIVGKSIRTLTAAGSSGWKDATTDQKYVPDMAFMAYWNGAYSGSSSNLAYCNRGAFGTIVTKNTGDYATAGHTHNYAGSSSAGGNANAAVKLATARTINGTSFDGSANITTSNWGTARNVTVGGTTKSVNGSGNVSWSMDEIGIHVSSTEPTASQGKNGDIWIVYDS